MHMLGELMMYVLSALILALGAVSLFVQKVYKVDQDTGEKIEIELPLLGKLKTNYPALAFAFLGAGLAAFTFNRTYEVTDQWVIFGQFKAPDSGPIDWTKGALTLFPKPFDPQLEKDGSFNIELTIPRSRKFEDVVGQITYSNWSGNVSAKILVDEEYQKFKKGDPTILKAAAGTTRRYKPVEVTVIPKATD
jgi:hypothetical protein